MSTPESPEPDLPLSGLPLTAAFLEKLWELSSGTEMMPEDISKAFLGQREEASMCVQSRHRFPEEKDPGVLG